MTDETRTYWLSMHLPYACRHSGVCCSSGWAIPVERSSVAAISRLRSATQWLTPVAEASADVAGVVARTNDGRCVFRGEGCEIHHAYGPHALPVACQHFPRVVVTNPRGVFVTLSHYCPTAADLLISHKGPVEIVQGPSVLPRGEAEGLDARDVLPPLLTDRILMDWDEYGAWEAHMVTVLTGGAGRAEDALARLESDWRVLQQWRPGGPPLSHVLAGFQERPPVTRHGFAGGAPGDDTVIRRYLAARAFASWQPYGTIGAEAVLAHLRRALAIVRAETLHATLKESIRRADLELVHRVG